mgnify:CR=1 FL=1
MMAMRSNLADGAVPATGGTGTSAEANHLVVSISKTSLTSDGTTTATLRGPVPAAARRQDSAIIGSTQPLSEDAKLGKATGQLVMLSAVGMAVFDGPNDSDPTTMLAILATRGTTPAACGRKAGPTTVRAGSGRVLKYNKGMVELLAPLEVAHHLKLASVSKPKWVGLEPGLEMQCLGSLMALPHWEKEKNTYEYAANAPAQLVVPKGEFLQMRRDMFPGMQQGPR